MLYKFKATKSLCKDWMCSVDLKDAYLSVPIAKQHRKFLGFVWVFKKPPTNLPACNLACAVHQKVAMSSDGPPLIPRSENCHLSGWPVDNGRGQGDVTTTGKSNPYVTGAAGIHHQYPKVLIDTFSPDYLPGAPGGLDEVCLTEEKLQQTVN